MKVTTTYALIWVSVAIAISVGIIVTGRLAPLWGFIFPALISFEYAPDKEESL